MVNVQPRNSKLLDRARRIVAAAVPSSREQAGRLLEAAGLDVRVAILMGKTGLSQEAAAHLLERSGGRVSVALAEHARNETPNR
jgi:N-acetylmuramic acid 6-phosphate etherase